MDTFKELERIKVLHELISQRVTGTPCKLASRFHISKRHIYNLLDELKHLGAEVKYSRTCNTFFYKNDFRLDITIKISVNKDD